MNLKPLSFQPTRAVESLLARHRREIDELANQIVQEVADAWCWRFPKRRLEILFGNGSVFMSVDGYQLTTALGPGQESHLHGRGFYPTRLFIELHFMLCYIDQLTDGFRRGCPNDYRSKNHA